MKLVRWTPMQDMASSFTQELEPFFNNGFGRGLFNLPSRVLDQGWQPVVDVEERENELVLNAELPGMKKKDIEISVEDNVLTLVGEKKTEDKKGSGDYYRSERFFGRFERSFTLPTYVETDKANATFKDGVLQIALPKKEEAMSRKITIN